MNGRRIEWTVRVLHRAEDAVLALLLLAMIGLSVAQILLRNLFDTGLPWADPLLRLLVLWLGLAGALAATRENKHIRIDFLPRVVPERFKRALDRAAAAFTALVCALLAWHGGRLVLIEFHEGAAAVAGIPTWLTEIIIPLGFGLMSVRFTLQSLLPAARQPRTAPEQSP